MTHRCVTPAVAALLATVAWPAIANDSVMEAVKDPANSGARVRMAIRDPARREVDPIAAQDPFGRAGIGLELPDERRAVHTRGPEVRLVALEVVHDAVSWSGLHTPRMLG